MSRKLDIAIAEALGYKVEWRQRRPYDDDSWHDYPCQPGDKDAFPVITGNRKVPQYSTDGNDMLDLVATMRAQGWTMIIDYKDEIGVIFNIAVRRCGIAHNVMFAKAVALAAYHALAGKLWQG